MEPLFDDAVSLDCLPLSALWEAFDCIPSEENGEQE